LLDEISLVQDEDVILFLKKSEADIYDATSPDEVQRTVGGELRVDDNLSVREKVEQELLHVAKNGDAAISQQAIRKLKELDSQLLLQPQTGVKTPEAREALLGAAMALRIKRGDDTALEEVLGSKTFSADKTSYLFWEDDVLREIGGVRKKSALPQLHKLLTHPSPAVRMEASSALQEIGDKTSIPYLIQGLNDSDPHTAAKCLSALCRITGRPGPGYKEFVKNRQKVAEEWKDWWKKQGQRKTP
jgi:hypothetical protein